MTRPERAAIERAIDEVRASRLHWYDRADGRVELHAGPCPFLEGTDCTIYPVRPQVCRGFMCGRLPGEPYESGGPFGCRNLEDRLADPGFAKQVRRSLRKADEWLPTP